MPVLAERDSNAGEGQLQVAYVILIVIGVFILVIIVAALARALCSRRCAVEPSAVVHLPQPPNTVETSPPPLYQPVTGMHVALCEHVTVQEPGEMASTAGSAPPSEERDPSRPHTSHLFLGGTAPSLLAQGERRLLMPVVLASPPPAYQSPMHA